MSRAEAKEALIGRFAVNGDNNKACVIDVFDLARNGVSTTVALLRYRSENDLSIRTIDALFEDYSVFWDEIAADTFISGHREARSFPNPAKPSEGKHAAPPLDEARKQAALSDRIKAARVAAGLTSTALGKLVGVPTQQVKKWEKGIVVPSRDELLRLEKATAKPIGYFSPDTELDRKKN